MGYGTNRFQKPIDPNLMCTICGGVLESAVLTPCGHSFCAQCMRTWLGCGGAKTCPQCRATVKERALKPILSLRNLIEAMEVNCEHAARGCKIVTTIEKQRLHLQSCKFVPVTCAGCATEVNSCQLADHQIECAAIQRELDSDEDNSAKGKKDAVASSIERNPSVRRHLCIPGQQESRPVVPLHLSRAHSTVSFSLQGARLLSRISLLEKQVARLLMDLHESHNKNYLLYLQYRKTKDKLENPQWTVAWTDTYCNFDFRPMEVGFPSQYDVARLSLFIARFLLQRPKHIDGDRAFGAIQRCYESFSPKFLDRPRSHDLHILLATAYASNWFSTAQKTTLSCWLQSVLMCQGCRPLTDV